MQLIFVRALEYFAHSGIVEEESTTVATIIPAKLHANERNQKESYGLQKTAERKPTILDIGQK